MLRLAFPVILSQAGQMLVQLVDNAMVGQLGAVPLAGVAFANAVFFMLFVFGTGMSLGLTPLVGEMYAVGNHRRSASFLQNSILFYACMGLLIFLLAMVVRPFMYHMGQAPEIVDQALPYFGYISVSVIPFMIFASFKQFLEGIGNTRVAMAIIITSNLINIFCNWLFIYGNWGAPALGAAGAGQPYLLRPFRYGNKFQCLCNLLIMACYQKDALFINFWFCIWFCIRLSDKERMRLQHFRVLFCRDLDILHKVRFLFVPCNLHNGNSWNPGLICVCSE